MARRNHQKRRPQARRHEDGTAKKRRARPPLEAMVMPRGRCHYTGLLMFTAEDAPEALRQAQATRAVQGNNHIEKRHFACSACDHHHLTSREAK